jgi:hypothetical protein
VGAIHALLREGAVAKGASNGLAHAQEPTARASSEACGVDRQTVHAGSCSPDYRRHREQGGKGSNESAGREVNGPVGETPAHATCAASAGAVLAVQLVHATHLSSRDGSGGAAVTVVGLGGEEAGEEEEEFREVESEDDDSLYIT